MKVTVYAVKNPKRRKVVQLPDVLGTGIHFVEEGKVTITHPVMKTSKVPFVVGTQAIMID